MEKQFRADALIDDKWKRVRDLEDKKSAIGVAKKALDIAGVRAARVVDLTVDKDAPHRVVWIDNRTVVLEETKNVSRNTRSFSALGHAGVPRRPNAPGEKLSLNRQYTPDAPKSGGNEKDLEIPQHLNKREASKVRPHNSTGDEVSVGGGIEAELDTSSKPLLRVGANHKIGIETRGGHLHVFPWGLWFKPHSFNINRQQIKILFSCIENYRTFSVMLFMQTGLEVYSTDGTSDWLIVGKRDQVTRLIDLHADHLITKRQNP